MIYVLLRVTFRLLSTDVGRMSRRCCRGPPTDCRDTVESRRGIQVVYDSKFPSPTSARDRVL